MMNLFALFLSLGFVITPTPQITAEVTEVEDNRAVVDVVVDRGYIADIYQFDFPTTENEYEYEIHDAYKGKELEIRQAYGTFDSTFKEADENGNIQTMYEFKSYDNDVWWVLSESEIGFVPINNKPYLLVYDENGTTKENHTCPEEYDCDCYCYDDLFLGVYEL